MFSIKTIGLFVGAAVVTTFAISAGVILANTYIDQKKQEEEKTQLANENLAIAKKELEDTAKELKEAQEKIETLAELVFGYQDHYVEATEAIAGAAQKIQEFVEMPMFTETKELSRKVFEIKTSIKNLLILMDSINLKMKEKVRVETDSAEENIEEQEEEAAESLVFGFNKL